MYGKVMGGKEGLYNANVSREEGQIGGFRIGEALDTVVQSPLVAIEQGDSGGGLFRRLADGNLELVGILSSKPAGDRAGEPEGNYATNRSLDFLKCVKASLERPALAQK